MVLCPGNHQFRWFSTMEGAFTIIQVLITTFKAEKSFMEENYNSKCFSGLYLFGSFDSCILLLI